MTPPNKAELPGSLALQQAVQRGEWPHTMDAEVWATEFRKRFDPTGDFPNRAELIGWFANAIMAGYDTAMSRAAPQVSAQPATQECTCLFECPLHPVPAQPSPSVEELPDSYYEPMIAKTPIPRSPSVGDTPTPQADAIALQRLREAMDGCWNADAGVTMLNAATRIRRLKSELDAQSKPESELVEALLRAADPFVRATRMQEPLNILDDVPVRDFIPGAWPLMKDARALVAASDVLRKFLTTQPKVAAPSGMDAK